MKTLILELPGLLDKHLSGAFLESLKQLELPLLSQLVSKANKCAISEFNGIQYSRLESSGDINPGFAAKLLNLTDENSKPFKYWFRADPIELLTDITTIHMKGNWHFKFSEHQIKRVETNINQCIEHLQAKFFLISETEGYIGCNQYAETSFISLLNALGNDQRIIPSTGNDAHHWQQLLTEIQMSLFGTASPDNPIHTRSLVNSIHFWGNPHAKLTEKKIDTLVSDSNLILGLAKSSGISINIISEFNSEFNFDQRESLQLTPMNLIRSQKHGDITAWENILIAIEKDWLPKIFSALKKQQLEQIILVAGENYYYRLKKSYLKKFWRRTKPLIEFIEG